MQLRFPLALTAALFSATPAFAEYWIAVPGTGWTFDGTAVRAQRTHPMERSIDAFMPGDRINFILRRTDANTFGTLSLNCTLDQFSMWELGSDVYAQDQPTASNPLAAHLSATYCSQIEMLPEIGVLPII